jgi:biotin synthase
VKLAQIGNKVHFRGLVEFSNICGKDCYYCGIRKSNKHTQRYNLSDEQILEAARFAHENRYGSFVMQAGELESKAFHCQGGAFIERDQKTLRRESWASPFPWESKALKYTVRWFEAGAHRYLLRIETSSPELIPALPSRTDSLHEL